MRRLTLLWAGALVVAAGVAGCERVKSSNPLSPHIAGPIAGVEISQPLLLEPASGAQVAINQQPIQLTIQNATTTGVRPIKYVFEIATDVAFTNVIFTQHGVIAGENNRTSFRMQQSLSPERTYFWRAQAQDGANAGDFSPPQDFRVYTPVIIQAPVLRSPSDGATVSGVRPSFVISNAAFSGPLVGDMHYIFEVATDASMANRVFNVEIAEGPSQTTFAPSGDLAFSTRYYWRVKAFDSSHVGPYSAIFTFVTGAPAPVPPPPGPGPSPIPGAGDEINLNNVTYIMGPSNVGSWPITSSVTGTTALPHNFCIRHTMLGQWPTVPFFGDSSTPLEGNQWVFANIGGRWYGGAADWYRPGQACKDVTAETIGRDAFYNQNQEPLHSWVPSVGETFGVMSTTPARLWPDMRTIDQRTNVVLIRWGM